MSESFPRVRRVPVSKIVDDRRNNTFPGSDGLARGTISFIFFVNGSSLIVNRFESYSVIGHMNRTGRFLVIGRYTTEDTFGQSQFLYTEPSFQWNGDGS